MKSQTARTCPIATCAQPMEMLGTWRVSRPTRFNQLVDPPKPEFLYVTERYSCPKNKGHIIYICPFCSSHFFTSGHMSDKKNFYAHIWQYGSRCEALVRQLATGADLNSQPSDEAETAAQSGSHLAQDIRIAEKSIGDREKEDSSSKRPRKDDSANSPKRRGASIALTLNAAAEMHTRLEGDFQGGGTFAGDSSMEPAEQIHFIPKQFVLAAQRQRKIKAPSASASSGSSRPQEERNLRLPARFGQEGFKMNASLNSEPFGNAADVSPFPAYLHPPSSEVGAMFQRPPQLGMMNFGGGVDTLGAQSFLSPNYALLQQQQQPLTQMLSQFSPQLQIQQSQQLHFLAPRPMRMIQQSTTTQMTATLQPINFPIWAPTTGETLPSIFRPSNPHLAPLSSRGFQTQDSSGALQDQGIPEGQTKFLSES